MPPAAYVICTAPRSGSTLLCSLLRATGVAGWPASYFHGATLADWAEGLDLPRDTSFTEMLPLALAQGRAGGDLFGLRLQAHSAGLFREVLRSEVPDGSSDLARIEQIFGPTAFVYLRRADKVDQAVSYVKAEQSGLWHMGADGQELERLAPHRDPVFDAAEIGAQVARMSEYDRDWDRWFAAEGIVPHCISYQHLAEDPAAVLRDLMRHLGLDPRHADGVAPGMRKLADPISRDWVARYRAGSETASRRI